MELDAVRCLSVDGLTQLGKGTLGVVYALGDDRVVKVFQEGYDPAKIVEEYHNTKNAWEAKVPCPRVYELVRTGNCLGIIMERLEPETMLAPVKAAAAAGNFKELGFLLDEFVRRAKQIHGIRVGEGVLPDMKEHYRKVTEEALSGKLSQGRIVRIKEIIEEIPEGDTFVHGDLNFSNVIYGKDTEDFRLIDVGGAATGDPLLDINILPALYYLGKINKLVYEIFSMDDVLLYRVCEGVCRRYYDALAPEEYARMRRLYYRSGALRLLIKLHEDGMLGSMPPEWVEKLAGFMDSEESEGKYGEL